MAEFLTRQEAEVLNEIPSGWFRADCLPESCHPRVIICNRLVKKGILRTRIHPVDFDQVLRGQRMRWDPEYRLVYDVAEAERSAING